MPEYKPNPRKPLPAEALKLLRGFSRRQRLLATARGIAAWIVCVIVLVLPALALDRFLLLEPPARVAISWVVVIATTLSLVLLVLLPLFRPGSRLRCAREIETREPMLEGALLSLVELSQSNQELSPGCSQELLDSLGIDTAQRCPKVKIDRLLPNRAAVRALLLAGATCLLPLAAALWDPQGVLQLGKRLLSPSTDLPRPTSVLLLVEVDRAVVGRGQEVAITVSISRGSPAELVLLSRGPHSPGGGDWRETHLLSAVDGSPSGELTHKLKALTSFDFRVRGGDYLSPVKRVEVRDPPSPRKFTITYQYPEYTARRARTIEKSSGNISALKGSRADLLVEADRELARATIILGAQKIEGQVNGALAAFGGITINEDAEYRLELETPSGITSTGKNSYSIRTLADNPPRIAILSPRRAELEVESSGSLQLRYRAEDDNGINSIELLLRTERELRVLPVFRQTSPSKRPGLRDAVYAFSIGATGARPPETLGLKLRVRDGLGGEGHSGELKLKVTWPGNSPEGPGWLAALRNLRGGVGELRALWRLAEDTVAGDSAAENIISIRSFSSELSAMCLETARKPPLPGANRLALESAAFRLLGLAEVEAGALWQAATSVDTDSKLASAGAVEAWKRGDGKLARLAELLEAILICEELEEAHESLRLAANDCALLSGELRLEEEGLPPRSEPRLARLLEEVLSCSAGVDRLRRELPPSRSKLIGDLEGSVRAMTSSLTAELELARKAAAKALSSELEAPLQRASEAFSRRIGSLGELLNSARLESREAMRWQVPESEIAQLMDAVKDSWLNDSPRRELLSATRAVFSRIAWRNKSGEDFDYPDFESAALLGAMAELLERAVENDLGGGSTPGDPGVKDLEENEQKENRLLVEGLARAAREIEPTLWLGRSLQLLQWISAGQESIALRLKELDEPQAIGRSLVRRSQDDITEALDALLLRLSSSSGPGAGIEREALSPVIDRTRQGLEAAERVLALLRIEPVDLPASASEAHQCAARLEEATGLLEKLRQDSLAGIADTSRWLRSNRGSLGERLARLAEGLETHGRMLKESATSNSIASEKGGELIVEALVAWSEELRQARKLARELRKEADHRADAGGDPAGVANLERASTTLLEIVAGPLARAGVSLRKALSTDRDDRELLLAAAAAGVFEAASETRELAEALEILGSEELANLSDESIDKLVSEAKGLAGAGSMDLALIESRARLLLDAALRGTRELSRRLGKLRSRADILAHLEAAAASFSAALDRVREKDSAGALARLGEGLARMEQAIALAKNARGEASKKLARPATTPVAESKPTERTELSRELESARRELEKLLELERLRKEASGLLERLLTEEENTPEQLAEAQAAQEELAGAMEEKIPATSMLIELIARIATLQKTGRGTAEDARYLEEEARLALAAAASEAPGKLIEKEKEVEREIEELVEGFSRAGFRLSMLLPSIFKSYRKAAATTGPLKESVARAGRDLANGELKAATDSLGDTNLQLGIFLTDLDQVRASAVEALAEAEAGGRSAYSSLQSALKNTRQAARLLSGGKIDDARKRNAAAKSQLLLAGRAIRRQLENVVLPAGEEGALVSRLLEAEAARLGLVWKTGTRGEEFEASSEDTTRGLEDMAFPAAYRDLVRIYLRAIRK